MQIVNVGCGMRPTPGALNIDNSMSVALGRRPTLCNACAALRLLPPDSLDYARFCQAHGITRMSCTKLKLLDDSVDVLYSSHMIEHLLRAHAALFLEEARRVLKRGGVLRLVAPDMRMLVQTYLADGDCDRLVDATLLANDHTGRFLDHVRYAVTGFRGHRWMYDAASLEKLLCAHGFTDIRALAPGETTIPFATNIDLWERADESIYFECRKPA